LSLTEEQINQVVNRVVENIKQSETSDTHGNSGVFSDMNDAVEAAHFAFLEFKKHSVQCRRKYIDVIRQLAIDHKEELSEMTVDETGMGRVDHKILKYINAAQNSPGVEELHPKAWSGKNGLALDEYAPFGVIGNITPSTHPGPVMINNIIIQLAGGNTIAFNPHPSAKKVNARVIQLANQYLTKAGSPENLVTCVAEPTLETAKILFGHPKVELLSVTGGPAVVDMAMQYPKKIIAAGPGNPPVLVDETADLQKAAKEITQSASYDNNILCIAEKEIFVVESVFDQFMTNFEQASNYRFSTAQMDALADKALQKVSGEYIINRDYVGKSAQLLAKAIGINIPKETLLLFAETDAHHRWVVAEQMTCCMPVVKVKNFEQGMTAALKAEHNFKHTASIYTNDMNRATLFTKTLDCDIHTINGGTIRGDGGDLGEGYFSHTIATPTGEGISTPKDFVRSRRVMVHGSMRFV